MGQIEELVRQGVSQAKIAELTGFDPKTVRKYSKQADAMPRYGPRKPRLSKLDRLKPFIEEHLRAGVWNAVVLLRELRERGYNGGYTILKDYLQPLRCSHRETAWVHALPLSMEPRLSSRVKMKFATPADSVL